MTYDAAQLNNLKQQIIKNGQEHLLRPENHKELTCYLGEMYGIKSPKFYNSVMGSSKFSSYGNGVRNDELIDQLEDLLDDLQGDNKSKLRSILSELKESKRKTFGERLKDYLKESKERSSLFPWLGRNSSDLSSLMDSSDSGSIFSRLSNRSWWD